MGFLFCETRLWAILCHIFEDHVERWWCQRCWCWWHLALSSTQQTASSATFVDR